MVASLVNVEEWENCECLHMLAFSNNVLDEFKFLLGDVHYLRHQNRGSGVRKSLMFVDRGAEVKIN